MLPQLKSGRRVERGERGEREREREIVVVVVVFFWFFANLYEGRRKKLELTLFLHLFFDAADE